MHRIEIVIIVQDSEKLRTIMDMVLRQALEILRFFWFSVSGVVMYNVPEEKEEEND